MIFREAQVADIPQMQRVRHAVKENVLSNPALVTDQDYERYLNCRGKGWVCVSNGQVVGFSMVDLPGKNIWALFVDPAFEKKGIGRKLHDLMLNWYFSQTQETVWLSTEPGSRAQNFYEIAGWQPAGTYSKGEVKFEMSATDWQTKCLSQR